MKETNYSGAWIKTGSICGLLGLLLYFVAAFAPLPPLATYVAAFAFGPLLAIGCVGLYYFLVSSDYSPRLLIATVSGVAGGLVLLLMLTVQQSSFAVIDQYTSAGGAAIKEGSKYISDGLNSIHFGIDIAWDILISIATVLYGFSLTKKSLYWKILGLLGCVFGLLLLSFNLYLFPNPPESVNSIDWGPFVALWYIVLFASVIMAIIRKKN